MSATGSFAIEVVVLLLGAAVAVLCVQAEADVQLSEYESYDAEYAYSVSGAGSDTHPYMSTLYAVVSDADVLYIPAAIEGYPLTTIREGALSGISSDTVVIPQTVTSVGPDLVEDGRSYVFLGDRPGGLVVPGGASVSHVGGASGWDDADIIPRETYTGNGSAFDYAVIEGEAVVLGNHLGSDLTIPSTLSGCPVTRIADMAFMDAVDLTSIYLEEGLETIGVRAFYRSGLVSADIPDSVRVFSDEAFRECKTLGNVGIAGAEFIGFEAFRMCYSFTEVAIPAGAELRDGCFYVCSELKRASVSGTLEEIPARAFGYSPELSEFVMQGSPRVVGQSAFYGCSSLESFDLTDTVEVGYSAFFKCGLMDSIGSPGELVVIGDRAFSECRALTTVSFPASLKSVGDSAFENCRFLTDAYFAGPMPEIGEYAFSGTDVTVHCTESNRGSWESYEGRLVVDPDADSQSDIIVIVSIIAVAIIVLAIALIVWRGRGR